MSMWKKFVIAVTAGCLAATGVSAGVPTAEAVVQPDHKPFKVLSYNVRYNGDNDGAKGIPPWTTRRPQVIALLRNNNPDIFTILEAVVSAGGASAPVNRKVKQNIPADLIAAFGTDYGYFLGTGTTDVPKLIFYRKSRFRLAAASDAQGTITIPNPYTQGVPVASTDCWGLSQNKTLGYAKLQDINSGRNYFVAAMHPVNNPNCYEGREKNRTLLQTAIETKATGMSVIAMGDMNTDRDCRKPPPWVEPNVGGLCYNLDVIPHNDPAGKDVITRIEEGGAGYNLYRSQRHSAPTTASDTTGNISWYTDAVTGQNASFDYILHSGVDMTTSSPVVDKNTYGGLDTPSDHYAISAIIQQSVFETGSSLDASGPGTNPGTKVYFTRVNADACADKVTWNPALNGGVATTALSNCNGTFAPPLQPPFVDNVVSASTFAKFYFADVDGNSCADKIYWNPNVALGATRVFLSNCNGTFQAPVSNANTASLSTNANYYFAKVTPDACEDLIYWNRFVSAGSTRVFKSNCNGTFGDLVVDTGGGSSISPTAEFFFTDVTGDGLTDKVAWDHAASSGHTRVYKGSGTGHFPFLSEQSSGGSIDPTTRFFFADVTGDHKVDKLAWRPDLRRGRIQIFPGTGTGFVNGPVMDNTGFSESADTLYSFADITGNGTSDKVYWNSRFNGGATRVYPSLK